jgi:hypothetical protein
MILMIILLGAYELWRTKLLMKSTYFKLVNKCPILANCQETNCWAPEILMKNELTLNNWINQLLHERNLQICSSNSTCWMNFFEVKKIHTTANILIQSYKASNLVRLSSESFGNWFSSYFCYQVNSRCQSFLVIGIPLGALWILHLLKTLWKSEIVLFLKTQNTSPVDQVWS